MPEADDFALGRAALLEITTADTVGADAGSVTADDGVVTVYFENSLAGYPGWRWTVSIAHLPGEEPSVLEADLTPGDGALLSPQWVPWVDRLAEYRAAQEALGSEAELDPEAETSDDDDEIDEEDFGSDVLHGGDLDGVDIDDVELEVDDDDDDDSDDDDDDDSDDDDDDSDEDDDLDDSESERD